MNNQIAPKQAAISHLSPNPVKDPTGVRTRDRRHPDQSDRFARSERTDSFGSALRRAVQKSRDGRVDTDRAVTKARDERRSASNDRPRVSDRRSPQSESVKSLKRLDERASVEDMHAREAGKLVETEQSDESGPANETDTSNTSNEQLEQQQQQQANSTIGHTAELVLNPQLIVEAVAADLPDVEAQDVLTADDEMLLEAETTGAPPASADPAEGGAVDSQGLEARVATAINLEEGASSSQAPEPDLFDGENEQGMTLESSESNTGNLNGRTRQSEHASLGGSGQKKLEQTAISGLAQQAASPSPVTDSDDLASMAETVGESAIDDPQVQGVNLDAKNSTESQSGDGQAASDSSLNDKGHSTDGPTETASQGGGAVRQEGPANLLTQPILANSGSAASTSIVDAASEVSAADARVLSAELPSTDGRSGDAVWRQVQRAIGAIRNLGEGDHEFKIRLTPRELGSVTIDIRSSEGGIAIGLVTETSAASDRLNEQRDQLLQELAKSGLDSSSVDISEEGSSFGLHAGGAGSGEGKDVSESESSGMSEQDHQPVDRTAQSPRRTLGLNQPGGLGRLDMAL